MHVLSRTVPSTMHDRARTRGVRDINRRHCERNQAARPAASLASPPLAFLLCASPTTPTRITRTCTGGTMVPVHVAVLYLVQ